MTRPYQLNFAYSAQPDPTFGQLCFHVNWKSYMACNFYCHIETKGLFKVARSHVHCESGNSVSETVQDRDVVTTDY